MKAACIILFIGLVTSESSIASVLSRLLDQAKRSKSQSPVILVINSRALEDSSTSEEAIAEPTFRGSGESNGISLMTILTQLQKARQAPIRRPRPRLIRKPQRPVYKSLLSLRNSLRCGAQDECKNECSEIPKPKEQIKCDVKCEQKYECEEEPKCEEGNCDDGNPSTRGPPPDEQGPTGCTRC
ncbi:uncharacterized protein LOC125237066 [Leguminivora glycinivorella]|uniref:uncharacterized protein LOC125237066 n=1 Tax=Leguminivora glycinivorella TaxID=1035111 RepID=UPI00200DB76A|nr:uncharacterized protein LOC125237066 [Leguminivora glycinivorella]